MLSLRRRLNLDAILRASEDVLVRRSQGKTEDLTRDDTWDDMVFENRNREYGAYAVRKGYRSNLLAGLIMALAIAAIVLAYPAVSKLLTNAEPVPIAAPRKLVYSELSVPPPIDKPKPPPPQIQLPRLKKVIKFVPPKVVREQIEESVPTLAEIKTSEIGSKAVEAPVEVIFDEVAADIISADDDEIFTVVDQQPEYAGGYEAMMAFIKQNMRYPTRARQLQIEGTVHVSFVVSKTGDISDVKVLRGIMTECDQEAVRVVKMMPRWNPGKQNGRPVNARFILPLKFRLN